jgi:hypothetical protein
MSNAQMKQKAPGASAVCKAHVFENTITIFNFIPD